MSGDWMKIEVSLPEKPEVWQIAGMVNIDPDAVVGKLLKVWRWFDAHTETGNAAGVTLSLVDHVAGVTGFGEAMSLCGWLHQDGSMLVLPNFDRHNGKTAKNRALTAKRVASHKTKSNAEDNAPIVTSALPREEKRREEQKFSSPTVVGGSRFEEFWQAYPNKTARKVCHTKWMKRKLDAMADAIIADVKAKSANDRRWIDGFVPNPETYLNQDRWDDPVQTRTNGRADSGLPDFMVGMI